MSIELYGSKDFIMSRTQSLFYIIFLKLHNINVWKKNQAEHGTQ